MSFTCLIRNLANRVSIGNMGELAPEEIVDVEHNLRKKPIIGGVEGSVDEVTANVGFNCKRKEVA